jgi:hypothetical protein
MIILYNNIIGYNYKYHLDNFNKMVKGKGT